MKQTILTYDSFKKLMTLVAYLEESASSMIQMLNNTTAHSESYFSQMNYYKCVLSGIRNRAQKIKIEWIQAAAEQNLFSEKIANIGHTYEKMQKDFKAIYEISEHIFKIEYFIDPNGILIKKIKPEVRNEN